MSRLTHTDLLAHVRSLQLSKEALFAYVEGRSHDEYFYGRVLETVVGSREINFCLGIATELPGAGSGGGGKQELLKFHQRCRRARVLLSDFKGKRTAIIFMVDKDIDDIRRTKKRCNHVIYTTHYDVENHIFAGSDLGNALAAAASIDRRRLSQIGVNSLTWRRDVANLWRDWVKLCILTQLCRIHSSCNYGVRSEVNTPYTSPVNRTALRARIAHLRASSGLSQRQFKAAFNRVSLLVDRIYAQDRFDGVFKGKWYSFFLEEEVANVAGRSRANGVGNRVASVAAAIADYPTVAAAFQLPLNAVLDQL